MKINKKIIFGITFLIASFYASSQLSGPTQVCDEGFGTYTFTGSQQFGNIYNWSVSGGGSLSSCTSCTSRSVSWNGSGGTVTLNVVNNYTQSNVTYTRVATMKTAATSSNVNHASRCGTGQISLSVSSPNGTYQWYTSSSGGSPLTTNLGAGISISGSGGSVLTLTSLSSTTTYYVKESTCNFSRVAVTATINPIPNNYTVQGGGNYCSGGSGKAVTLSNSQSGIRYQLKRNGSNVGGTINGGSGSINFGNQTAAGNYTVLAINNSTGCSRTMSTSVNVNIDPLTVAGSISGISNRCGTGASSFTLSGHTGTIDWWQYRYKNGSGGWSGWTTITNTDNTTSVSPTLSQWSSGQRTYEIRAEVQSGTCSAAYPSRTVTVDPSTVAGTVSSSLTNKCGSGSVNFSIAGHTGTIERWQSRYKNGTGGWSGWSTFEETNNVTSKNLTLSEWIGGRRTYEIQAVVKSGTCTTLYPKKQVTVDPPTQAGYLIGASTQCGSGNSSFSIDEHRGTIERWESRYKNGTGSYTNWTIITETDNVTSVNPSLSHWSSGDRTYEIRATVRSGVCSAAYPSKQIVLGRPTVSGTVTSSVDTNCGSGSVNFSISGHTGTVLRWQSRYKDGVAAWTNWDTFEETDNVTSKNLSVSEWTSGTRIYEVQAVVQSGGCTTLYPNKQVNVDPGTVAGTLSGATEKFQAASGSLTLSGHTGAIQKWQFKTASIDWTHITHTSSSYSYVNVTEPTWYRAEVKSGVCGALYSNEVLVNILDTPMGLGSTQHIRHEQSTNLTAESGHSNYQWFKDNGSVQNSSSNQLTVTHPGDYKVTITSSGGATYTTGIVKIASQFVDTLNYVRAYDFRVPTTDTDFDVFGFSKDELSISTTYIDDLGRQSQQVAVYASPSSGDLVSPIAYDAFGRNTKEYKSFSSHNQNAFFKENAIADQANFYAPSQTKNYALDTVPYAERILEPSPTGRVTKQYGLGDAWKDNNRFVSYDYGYNTVADSVVSLSFDSLLTGALRYYTADELHKQQMVDEDSTVTIEFTNRQGQTILKKSLVKGNTWTETYYLYDIYRQLGAVLPPMASDSLKSGYFGKTLTLKKAFLNRWAFLYDYDGRFRMTMKKVPGADTVFMVYDQWDRLVLTQDGNQRAKNNPEWLFTKYDALNRPIMTGIMESSSIEATIRSAVASASARYDTLDSAGTNQYSSLTYPTTGIKNYLTVTYYDSYAFQFHQDWINVGLGFTEPVGLTQNTNVKGQVTGTMTKVADGTWIRTVSYYDNRYRPIQSQSTNHLGGKDVVTNYYDFIGQVTRTISSHSDGSETTTIERDFVYDHVGRLLETWHQLDDEDSILVSSNSYNEVGELIEKDLHAGEQSVDYKYNIRGWLSSINDVGLTDGEGDLFGMELLYNTIDGSLSNTALYNGNISAMKWSDHDAGGENIDTRAFTYGYDKLNRLTAANHFEDNTSTNKYGVSGLTYDLNGNIEALKRRSTSTTAYMDDLAYDYVGNQLQYVNDLSSDSLGFDNNGTGTSIDYTYDANGNMVSDENKEIDSIYYNHLNLPVLVDFETSGDSISYLYDAAGIKLHQKVWEDDTLRKTTDYVGEFIYEDGLLQLIQHEEGRIIQKTTEEFIFDKLGNATTGYSVTHTTGLTSDGTYIQATANQDTGTPGVWPIDGTFSVTPGETYTFRVKGYREVGVSATLYVYTDLLNLVYLEDELPEGIENEKWITKTFTIPAGKTLMKAGVLFNGQEIGDKFYIREAELVKVLEPTTYDYQYHLKDHLGNTRVTFSTTPENYTMTETFETGEENGFQDLHRHTSTNANTTAGGNEVERLQSGQTGAMIFLSINKGDTVDLNVQANYESAPTGNTFLQTGYNALFTAFDNVYGGAEGVTSAATDFNDAISGTDMAGKSNTSTAPRAFLNYIIFDKEMNYETAGFEQISTSASGVGVHENVVINDIIAELDGYLLAYLSNENSEAVDVHFDDFTVYQGKTNVVQSDDYYPFGLTFNGYQQTASSVNRFKYNGFENMTDLGLNLYDYQARYYDPAIGRFLNVDPAADLMRRHSPYNYAFDNPIRYIDPDGMMPTDALAQASASIEQQRQEQEQKQEQEPDQDTNGSNGSASKGSASAGTNSTAWRKLVGDDSPLNEVKDGRFGIPEAAPTKKITVTQDGNATTKEGVQDNNAVETTGEVTTMDETPIVEDVPPNESSRTKVAWEVFGAPFFKLIRRNQEWAPTGDTLFNFKQTTDTAIVHTNGEGGALYKTPAGENAGNPWRKKNKKKK